MIGFRELIVLRGCRLLDKTVILLLLLLLKVGCLEVLFGLVKLRRSRQLAVIIIASNYLVWISINHRHLLVLGRLVTIARTVGGNICTIYLVSSQKLSNAKSIAFNVSILERMHPLIDQGWIRDFLVLLMSITHHYLILRSGVPDRKLLGAMREHFVVGMCSGCSKGKSWYLWNFLGCISRTWLAHLVRRSLLLSLSLV